MWYSVSNKRNIMFDGILIFYNFQIATETTFAA